MSTPTPIALLDDLAARADTLDFEPYIATLADLMASPNTATPLTIGVFGTWGSGKSSLMGMVRSRLPAAYGVVWFDAWKYEQEATLWRALLTQVLGALKQAVPAADTAGLQALTDLETALYRAVDREEVGDVRLNWEKVGLGLGKTALHVGLSFLPGGPLLGDLLTGLHGKQKEGAIEALSEAIYRERSRLHVAQIQFLEQFQGRFQTLVERYLRARGQRLIVFVDDLDRCLPEKAIEVLEAIKLFMDVPGCIFVLGVDEDVIERGIEIKYRELTTTEGGRFAIDGTRYLEKIIQLPFQIPPIERGVMADFVRGLVAEWPDVECPVVFAESLGGNPRQVKRTVNVFLLLWQLAQRRAARLQGLIKPIRLAKIVSIQQIYPELYDVLKETPRLLSELEGFYRADDAHRTQSAGGPADLSVPAPTPPERLAPYVGRAAVRRLLTLHAADAPETGFAGLDPEELSLYFTLTRRVESPTPAAAKGAAAAAPPRLPQMVTVPAGRFQMGTTDEQLREALARGYSQERARWEQPALTLELPEFAIGRFPVTNLEYQAFVREANLPAPRHWDGDQYPEGKGDHPVVNVSWEEARAYCRWLSERTGQPYRLPSEAEWEKAARGVDGRTFPWGEAWEPARLNCVESAPPTKAASSSTPAGDTSPVGRFSPLGGDSPIGLADAAGNVWEWCEDGFDPELYQGRARYGEEPLKLQPSPASPERVIRGGSFYDYLHTTRTAARNRTTPLTRNAAIGFRVALGGVISQAAPPSQTAA